MYLIYSIYFHIWENLYLFVNVVVVSNVPAMFS
jgi:hypothetical protein